MPQDTEKLEGVQQELRELGAVCCPPSRGSQWINNTRDCSSTWCPAGGALHLPFYLLKLTQLSLGAKRDSEPPRKGILGNVVPVYPVHSHQGWEVCSFLHLTEVEVEEQREGGSVTCPESHSCSVRLLLWYL